MINKKNIWFLTLFSLVLVLSVYYITMPSDVLVETSKYTNDVNIEEVNSNLVAIRVSKEESVLERLESLNNILTDVTKSALEKSEAYEEMKGINEIKGREQTLENKVKDTYNIDSVVSIDGDSVKVYADSDNHDINLANNIMHTVQESFDNKMYVSVKFE